MLGFSARRLSSLARYCGPIVRVARTGGPVALWGHSYGAGCAMGGAALTSNVDHLLLPGTGDLALGLLGAELAVPWVVSGRPAAAPSWWPPFP